MFDKHGFVPGTGLGFCLLWEARGLNSGEDEERKRIHHSFSDVSKDTIHPEAQGVQTEQVQQEPLQGQ